MPMRFLSAFGEIEYEKREFESECFRNKTFEIYNWKADGKPFKELFDSFILDQNLLTGDLVYTRKAANDTKHIQEANSAGFYYIETSIEPYIETDTWERSRFADSIIETNRATDEDKAELIEIAQSMFKDLRFNLDRSINNDLANYRYSKWLNNLYENNHDIQLIKMDGKIIGFMAINHKEEQSVWILAGIREGYHGQGLGLTLYSSALDYCINKGVKYIISGFSVSNIPVFSVYCKLGFKFKNPTVVLHYNV